MTLAYLFIVLPMQMHRSCSLTNGNSDSFVESIVIFYIVKITSYNLLVYNTTYFFLLNGVCMCCECLSSDITPYCAYARFNEVNMQE